jgi:uncharacterized protein YjbJ (UPF0337 family)
MDEQRIKGAVDHAKGAIKDAVGGLTGDTKMQAEGKMDKLEGNVRDKVGQVKDEVRAEDQRQAEKDRI